MVNSIASSRSESQCVFTQVHGVEIYNEVSTIASVAISNTKVASQNGNVSISVNNRIVTFPMSHLLFSNVSKIFLTMVSDHIQIIINKTTPIQSCSTFYVHQDSNIGENYRAFPYLTSPLSEQEALQKFQSIRHIHPSQCKTAIYNQYGLAVLTEEDGVLTLYFGKRTSETMEQLPYSMESSSLDWTMQSKDQTTLLEYNKTTMVYFLNAQRAAKLPLLQVVSIVYHAKEMRIVDNTNGVAHIVNNNELFVKGKPVQLFPTSSNIHFLDMQGIIFTLKNNTVHITIYKKVKQITFRVLLANLIKDQFYYAYHYHKFSKDAVLEKLAAIKKKYTFPCWKNLHNEYGLVAISYDCERSEYFMYWTHQDINEIKKMPCTIYKNGMNWEMRTENEFLCLQYQNQNDRYLLNGSEATLLLL